MVDIAKFFLEFTVDESCGKCTPCRVGTKRLLELLDKITSGKGTMEDLDKITELAEFIKANSLCGLGPVSYTHLCPVQGARQSEKRHCARAREMLS